MNSLFVAWRSGTAQNGEWGPVGRLDFDGSVYRFCYTKGAQRLSGFRPFPQMEDLEQVYESDSLFPLFSNRLLSKSRPEYEDFLRWGGFDPNNPPDPIVILGVTEGIRKTDQVEVFPCPIPDDDLCYLNKFFLHGIRLMPSATTERIRRLESDERLFVMLDLCNEHDPNAVAVRTEVDLMMIGYVPRYLAHDILQLLEECEPDIIELFVERVNADAPLQQRVLCRMRACWPEGFQPCNEDIFHPIPSNISSSCET